MRILQAICWDRIGSSRAGSTASANSKMERTVRTLRSPFRVALDQPGRVHGIRKFQNGADRQNAAISLPGGAGLVDKVVVEQDLAVLHHVGDVGVVALDGHHGGCPLAHRLHPDVELVHFTTSVMLVWWPWMVTMADAPWHTASTRM